MNCFMCFSSDDKMQRFEDDTENDILKKITATIPDFSIPKSRDPVFICSTCLEQISLFYSIKKTSLQNCSRLKDFNAVLKGTDNFKCNYLKVIINNDKVSTHLKNQIECKVNSNTKYSLSSEAQNVTYIKKEDNEHDYHNQQLVNEETSSNHLKDEGSSSSNNSRKKHKNSNVNKFTKKDSNLTSTNSHYEDQPKTQRGSQKKIFECTDCLKTFTKRCNLKDHIRVHTGEKPFKCTTCQKTFTHSSSLDVHKLTHTGEKPHECDVCHKTFNHKSNLVTHKRIHTNMRPFQCAVCNKGFTTSSLLTRHMLTHTGEKPHQCHLCEYKCSLPGYLKIHIRRHTGEKPYSCKHCKKSFAITSNLKAHKRRLHSNEDSN